MCVGGKRYGGIEGEGEERKERKEKGEGGEGSGGKRERAEEEWHKSVQSLYVFQQIHLYIRTDNNT